MPWRCRWCLSTLPSVGQLLKKWKLKLQKYQGNKSKILPFSSSLNENLVIVNYCSFLTLNYWQWLFCCQWHFTLGSYFAVRHFWLVNFNDELKKFAPTVYTFPHCILTQTFKYQAFSSVHCLCLSALQQKLQFNGMAFSGNSSCTIHLP